MPTVRVVRERGASRRGDIDEVRSDLVVSCGVVIIYFVINAVLYWLWFHTGSAVVGLTSGAMTVAGLIATVLLGRRRSRRCM